MLNWKEIIEEHGPAVWKRVFRIVGSDADASDCFQEVFLKAIHVSRRENIANMSGFLNVTATRCALDLLRKRKRLPFYSTDESGCELIYSNENDPSQAASGLELAESLRAGLARLPAAQAEAFALLAFEELSYRQIADHMRISENHVAVLINRSRKRLREILKSTAVEYDREVPYGT